MLDEWERRTWAAIERDLARPEGDPGERLVRTGGEPSRWLRYVAAVAVPLSLPALALLALHPLASSATAVLVATVLCGRRPGRRPGPSAPPGRGDQTSTS